MKHLFITLLIACSTITTASAQQKGKPENVIKTFEFLIDLYGQKAGQTYSVEKNPNTGIIESSERIVAFTCKKSEPYIEMIGDDFMKDEPLSYQIKHITPGQGSQNFTLAVHTNVPNVINHYAIRTKPEQEMWFIACKNPDNPSLRDAYAIVWQPATDNKVKGTIYMITSPRPSNFGKAFESADSKTKIDNVVGEVVDEAGNRVGDVVEEEVAVDTVAVIDDFVAEPPVVSEFATPQPSQTSKWKPSQQQMVQLLPKANAIQANMDAIKATYKSLEPLFKTKNFTATDQIFAHITKQNKALDENFQELIKALKGFAIPYDKRAEFFSEGYKEILKFYTEQNQGFTEILKEFGTLPKGAQKTQKALNKLIEKNMTEMSRTIAGL